MKVLLNSSRGAALAGLLFFFEAELAGGQKFEGFPAPTPIGEADPTVRVEQSFRVPTRMVTTRTAHRIGIGLDAKSLEEVKLKVGAKMVTGAAAKEWVYPLGEERPKPQGGSLGYGLLLGGVDGLCSGTTYRDAVMGGIPVPGIKYVVEIEISIFETDIPAQHMWMPEGPKYKVLWTRTLKQVVE